MKRFNLKLSILIALVLIAGGLAFIMYARDRQTVIVTPAPTKTQIAAAKAASPVAVQTATESAGSGEPVALSIPSLSINLAITPGVYNQSTGQWTLTSDKAQYAVVTPEPNTVGGNTFIYGHYRKGVFATLHTIQMGSEAKVSTDDGKTYTYKLMAVQTVSPDQSDQVLNYQGAPILTIQTCAGLLFQDRQLFQFSLEGVS